jgi:hypothetical protein
MHRSGPATPPNPARAVVPVPVAWLLVLLLPLHAFGVAFLPAWMPAHHHRGDAPGVAPPLAAVRANSTPINTPIEASAAIPQRAVVNALADSQPHASVGRHAPAHRPDPAHSHSAHEHDGRQHRHAHATVRLHEAEDGAPQRRHMHGARSHRHYQASVPHDHATASKRHHNGAHVATAVALASQSVVEPSSQPLTREATAPHDHATIGRHHHGADGAATMVLTAQPAGDPVDAAPVRGGWDVPWPLLPAAARVPACGTESTLRAHVPQPYLPPALAGPLRPPRHHA